MPARIRHIALSVKDIDATADFYEKAFGLTRSPKSEGPTAFRVYMSDGEINLALLQYKSEVGSGLKKPGEFVGIHHFGFQCDDLEAQQKQIEGRQTPVLLRSRRSGRRRFRAQVQGPERHHLRHQLERLGADRGQGGRQGQEQRQEQIRRGAQPGTAEEVGAPARGKVRTAQEALIRAAFSDSQCQTATLFFPPRDSGEGDRALARWAGRWR